MDFDKNPIAHPTSMFGPSSSSMVPIMPVMSGGTSGSSSSSTTTTFTDALFVSPSLIHTKFLAAREQAAWAARELQKQWLRYLNEAMPQANWLTGEVIFTLPTTRTARFLQYLTLDDQQTVANDVVTYIQTCDNPFPNSEIVTNYTTNTVGIQISTI